MYTCENVEQDDDDVGYQSHGTIMIWNGHDVGWRETRLNVNMGDLRY